MKKAVVIYYEGKPIQVCELKEFSTPLEVFKLTEESNKNLIELVNKYKGKIESLESDIDSLQKAVEQLKVEIKYDRGEITEEEYKLCLGNK